MFVYEAVLMIKQIRIFILAVTCFSVLHSYVDNRFLFPFNSPITYRTRKKPSRANVDIFFMTGDEARDEHYSIRLPDLGGMYDLAKLNTAMNLVGCTNPLYLTEWQTSELPYVSYGKIGATGLDFALEYGFNANIAAGIAFSLMHVHTRYDYYISDKAKENLRICSGGELYPGRQQALEQARLNANKLLCLNAGQWNITGLSDSELYLRVGTIKDYWWKFRQIDASVQLGAIFPTGEIQSVSAQSSIPFGGNGHFGLFAQGEVAVELTDDLFLGLWLYGSKRFSKSQLQRMPMDCEPIQFGVLVDRARVIPGWTIAFSPYILFEDIQDGFGAYAGYTFVHHTKDQWRYTGKYCPKLNRLCDYSKWTNGFFTIGVDYDFTKGLAIREYGPRVYFDFTLPTEMFDSKCVAKTYRVTLGIEFHF